MENAPKNSLTGKDAHQFGVDVDGVKYFVTAQPLSFNDEVRYRIAVNGRDPDIFAWDNEVEMFRPVDDDATVLPDGLLRDINNKLMSLV